MNQENDQENEALLLVLHPYNRSSDLPGGVNTQPRQSMLVCRPNLVGEPAVADMILPRRGAEDLDCSSFGPSILQDMGGADALLRASCQVLVCQIPLASG